MTHYDALLLISFGGPEGKDDVLPFLENVLRGKNVPRERMLEVAEHYNHFDGVSPINEQNRQLIACLEKELREHEVDLPIYWGNRNWEPYIPDALRKMRDDGKHSALAIFTSAFSSYSGCRQYRENIAAAQAEVGEDAPTVDKVRMYFNHPGFIETMASRVSDALEQLPADRRGAARLIFTAHSIPLGMATNCDYELQLREASRLVTESLGRNDFTLVYQSRSGPPSQPWLEPDICDYLNQLADQGEVSDVVICPIGFVSDHMEVLFDLDEEAAAVCEERGLGMARALAAGTHPRYVAMLRELVVERIEQASARPALGELGAWHDVCPPDCCLYDPPRRR